MTAATTSPSTPTVAPVPDVAPDVRPTTGDGDHDRFAHYVDKAEMARAYVEGTPVRALCGKVWVPSRDPSRYPVCPTCREIMDAAFGRDRGDGDGGN
jgi:hypothetical protein